MSMRVFKLLARGLSMMVPDRVVMVVIMVMMMIMVGEHHRDHHHNRSRRDITHVPPVQG